MKILAKAFRLITFLILIITAPKLNAQDSNLSFIFSGQPGEGIDFLNGGTSGRWWDFHYDECTGRLLFGAWILTDFDSDEISHLNWIIRREGNIIAQFQYRYNYPGGGWNTATEPHDSNNIYYRVPTGEVGDLQFISGTNSQGYLQFTWAVDADVHNTDDKYYMDIEAAMDNGFISKLRDVLPGDKGLELSFDKVNVPVSAPSVVRHESGSNFGMKINYTLPAQCSGSFSSGQGPHYQILRFEEGSTDSTVVREDAYTPGAIEHVDILSPEEECKLYSYAIGIIVKNPASMYNGRSSKSTAFSYTEILAEPDNIAASNNSCDGAITLTWTWSQDTPDGFAIERKAPGDADFSEVTRVDGTLREFKDDIDADLQSQTISYRVRTISACGLTAQADLTTVDGVAPAALEVPTNITATVVESGGGKFIRLGWDDNSSSESKYIITRQFQSGGGLVTYEVDANATSFDDENVQICQPYRYQIKVASDCAPEGIFEEEVEITINADLTEVLETTSLKASRGYFKDRITLDWTVAGEFDFVDRYKIYSRPLGSAQNPVLVTTVNGSERSFDDQKAEAGELLEYFIIGETNCGENLITTNDNASIQSATQGVGKAVGFRSPEGVINGNISYSGGNAVKDVKVIVESDGSVIGKSLSFDGDDQLTISDASGMLNASGNNISLSLYLNPTLVDFPGSEAILVQKSENFRLRLANDGTIIWDMHDGSDWVSSNASTKLSGASYVNLNITYDGSKVRFYIDGSLDLEVDQTITLPEDNTSPLIFGQQYAGLMDELSIWNVVRTTAQIGRDYVRILNNTEEGLVGYWPINVGAGTAFFDASKIGNAFNGNDGVLDGASWSDDIPDGEQLSTLGYTDERGNYTVSGVKFQGAGENFKVTPSLGVHQFNPSQKIIFIGDGNLVQNGVDFEDQSSFRVTGKVVFDYKSLGLGSEGVRILLDGQPVVDQDAKILVTDEFGAFELDVPIGDHVIQAVKEDHNFQDEGRFPAAVDQSYNFNEPLSGLTFTDVTKRKLIGKVVGGTREGDKPIGFGNTVNNIGTATFTLKSKDGLLEELITTDATTGEYDIELPPKVYDLIHPIDSEVGAIRVAGANLKFTTNFPEIDILNNYEPDFEYDTVAFADNVPLPAEAVRVDTVDNNTREVRRIAYDYKFSHIYRKAAEVFVYDANEEGEKEFFGDRTLTLEDDNGDEVIMPLVDGSENFALDYPLVQQNHTYGLLIKVQELYENHDAGGDPVVDRVPVKDATILIENNMMTPFYPSGKSQKTYPLENGVPKILLDQADGDTTVLFRAEDPELNANINLPELSFTKSFKITVLAGGNLTSWPNAADQNEVQPIYVLGDQESDNFSFVTGGPEVVQHIIRDPYGGESYAFLEAGETITTSSSFSYAKDESATIDGAIGAKGFGASVVVTGGFEQSSSYERNGTVQNEITVTRTYQTRDDAQEVGAGGDLYIANSNNYRSGFSNRLRFVDVGVCSTAANIQCLDDSPIISDGTNQFKLAKTFAAFIAPNGTGTTVIYSQNHILSVLIPDLINVRNTFLSQTGSGAKYKSNISPDHELYGSNNDDSRWNLQDNNPLIYDFEDDHDGPSYTFTPEDNGDRDSVAIINQQIRLWQEAIARNEREKVRATQVSDDEKTNYSLAAGAGFDEVTESSRSSSYEVTYGMGSAFSVGFEFDIDPDLGLKFNLTANMTVSQNFSSTNSTETTEFTNYGFHLFEPDVGDFVSMDVVPGENGNGPIFILQGGETSCPHEEAYTTQFFDPGTVIGKTTFQRDKPRLEVDVSQLYNVPADGQAAFNLTLNNDSESGDGFNFTMFVIDETNPDGAIISMDGEFFDQNRTLFVNGNSSIRKTVTLERGPNAYDYEDIKIVLASVCQSDPTDFEKIIADTVSVSAFFLPICTTPEILSPDDNWTLNNRFDDQMEVLIGDYDINFPGFEYLELQYKSAESSAWIPIQRFYRDLQESGNPSGGIQIPRNNPNISYNWDVKQVLDGNYDLRVVSDCEVLSTGGRVEAESGIKSGIIDRINPHVFGSPQPADGVLSPGDEISIQFNEPINTALLSPANFVIKGVLNGGDIAHNVSVGFDGTGNESIEIANAPNLRRRNFLIDFWARRSSSGAQVILHQGATAQRMLQLGFDDQDQVYFEMNGERFTSDISVTGNSWTHYAFAYNDEEQKVEITVASAASTQTDMAEGFDQDYEVDEPLILGQSAVGDKRAFEGNLHELRIWSRLLSETELAVMRNQRLSSSTSGLLANWLFEEGVGNLSLDLVKVRQAAINAGWSLEPSGKSVSFDGSTQYLQSNGIGVFGATQDFSMEMWFKTSSDADMTLFSNGKGDDTDDNEQDWTIQLSAGKLSIHNNGQLVPLDANVADGTWHHLAITVNRTTNLQVFIDGELAKSVSSDDFGGFGNDLFWYGRRSWTNGGAVQSDQHFEGQIDEFRLWSTVRSQDEILYSRYNNLTGDELGLVLYYPFEAYQEQAGILVSAESNASGRSGAGVEASFDQQAAYADDVPPIRLPRPLQLVSFNYSANGDEVILTTNEDNARLENVVLQIGVDNIRDLNGNLLSAPVTWTAFVDRNDVVWLDDELSFEKPVDEEFSFTTEITNTGGQFRNFEISNLPFWLTASPMSGQIEPTRSQTITFTVNAGLNIGSYNELIHLTTEFGFDEKLDLSLDVFKTPPPNWQVSSEDFQSSMSVVGQLQISGVFSRDENDLLAAFVNDECRGLASLRHIQAFNNYQVFLSIFTDISETDDIVYKIWDASEGKVYTGLEVSETAAVKLSPDGYFGEPAAPVIFEASDFEEQSIAVKPGWQWLSFNLSSNDLSDVNAVLKEFEASENDQIKGIEFFDQYDPVNGWIGTLTANGGIQNERMYKLNVANAGRISYAGSLVDAPSTPIALAQGWNWLGFFGQQSQDINEALSNISDLTVGDRIKGQLDFAVYAGPGIGWVGSLKNLRPGEGYMFLAQNAGSLTYPEISGRLGDGIASNPNKGADDISMHDFSVNPGLFESNMNFIIALEGEAASTLEKHILVKSEGQPVGWGDKLNVEGKTLYFITVHGNGGESLEFSLVSAEGEQPLVPERGQGYEFRRNQNEGTINFPEWFALPEEAAIPLVSYPNPFRDELTVSWPKGASPEAVMLMTSEGKELVSVQKPQGQQQVFATQLLDKGLYLVRVVFEDRAELLKVIKY